MHVRGTKNVPKSQSKSLVTGPVLLMDWADPSAWRVVNVHQLICTIALTEHGHSAFSHCCGSGEECANC